MYRMYRSLLLILMTTLFCFGFLNESKAQLTIENIRFGEHPGKQRLVIDLNSPTVFRVFSLQNPSRLVIDFPEFEWKPEKIQNTDKSMVTGVRQGNLKPGISRIVMDLSNDVEVFNAFLLQHTGSLPNRLVVDYGIPKSGDFLQKKFGTLSIVSTPENTYTKTPHPSSSQKQKPNSTKKPLIVIDAGHGGIDPGAIGKSKIHEKNITLGITQRLKKAIEKTGKYDVYLTRPDDRFVKLYERVRKAQNAGGDLFISIHADSIDNRKVRGVSVYTLSNTASDKQTAKLAARENKVDLIAGVDLSSEDEEVANILLDLVRRDTMNQSKFFANTIVQTFRSNNFKLLDNPHRYAGFAVLKAPDIPSILIETGFVSNSSEAKRLMQADYQNAIADTIAEGIDQYFQTLEQNNSL